MYHYLAHEDGRREEAYILNILASFYLMGRGMLLILKNIRRLENAK
jgi:hypothetical protein